MDAEVAFWLERAVAVTELSGPSDYAWTGDRDRFVALLPPLTAVARLWGQLDPSRAAGAAAGVPDALLRGAMRAAAMEFAPWPVSLAGSVLRRAEADVQLTTPLERTEPELVLDLWDELAVAWARREPRELGPLYRRLHATLRPSGSVSLWVQTILRRAAERSPLPGPELLEPAAPAQLRRLVRLAPSTAQRVRACLALAVQAAEAVPPADSPVTSPA